MGFLDNLRTIGEGIGDMIRAPLGFIWDGARAIISDDYAPGFEGLLYQQLELAGTGAGRISEASGLSKLGEGIAAHTPIDEVLMGLVHEGELIYNTEYQKQTNDVPFYAAPWQQPMGTPGARGVEPGELSIQRAAAVPTGAVGAALPIPGGEPISSSINVQQLYRRSSESTPGRALVDNAVGFYDMTPAQQKALRSDGWYNFITGSIDAVSRWYLQPEVLAGKGIKRFRAWKNPNVESLIKRAERKTGMTFEEFGQDVGYYGAREDGPVFIQATGESAKGRKLVHVTRRSAAARITGNERLIAEMNPEGQIEFNKVGEAEGIKRVPAGADTAYYSMESLEEHTQILEERLGMKTGAPLVIDSQGLGDEYGDWLEEITARNPGIKDNLRAKSIRNDLDRQRTQGYRDPIDASLGQDTDPNFSLYVHHKMTEGLARRALRNVGVVGDDAVDAGAKAIADFDILKDSSSIRGVMGKHPEITEDMLSAAFDDVKRSSFEVQTYIDNPVNQPPDGLIQYLDALDASETGVHTRTRMSMAMYNVAALRSEAKLTMDNYAGRGAYGSVVQNSHGVPKAPAPEYRAIYLLDESEVDEAYRYAAALYQADPTDPPVMIHLNADGLPVVFEDYAKQPHPPVDPRSGEAPDASLMTLVDKIDNDHIDKISEFKAEDLDATANIGKVIPKYLEPGGRMHRQLFRPDGTAIEPWEIIDYEAVTDDLLTGTYLWNQDPVLAQKFFDARARERAWNAIPRTDNPVEMAMSHNNVQAALNNMHGKTADQIRRIWFSNHPFGAVLAHYLAEAKTYQGRRAILAASMGFRLPEFSTLPQILQAKLNVTLRELDKIRKGGNYVHDERMLAMLDEPSRYTNLNPEEMKLALEETLDTLQDKQAAVAFLDEISKHPVLREVPKKGGVGIMAERVRTTHFYQQTPLGRMIRVMTEMRPHRWVNVKDTNADIQLVRQLEEAAPLGISAATVSKHREKFMRATNSAHRIQVLSEAEDEIIRAAAKRAKMTPEELEELIDKANQGRQRVSEFLGSARYGPNKTDQVTWYDQDTGETIVIAQPMLSTQLRDWMPMADVRELIRYSTKIGRLREKGGQAAVRHWLDSMNQLWKPTVLLRGGWMLRVVSDEQLRILAKTGALLKHLAAIGAGEKIPLTGIFSRGQTGGQRLASVYATATGTQPLTWAVRQGARAVTAGAKALHRIDPDFLRWLKEAGEEPWASSRAAFAGPNEKLLEEMSALFGQSETMIFNHLIDSGSGQWQSIGKGDRLYGQSWLRVLNHQLRPDPLAHKIAEAFLDMSEDSLARGLGRPGDADLLVAAKKVMDDFIATPEGKDYISSLPWREQHTDKWSEDLTEMITYYTADLDHGLLNGVVTGGLKTTDLEKIDEAIRPPTVHSEIVDQALRQGGAPGRFIRDFLAGGFELLGRLPTDTLSRQPFFKHLWADEMVRLERHATKMGVDIDEQWIKSASGVARKHALHEVKEYLYDLAETSRFGHMMRFFFPFYSAWQETLKVWGKLSLKDPSIPARGYLLWKAPDRAGLTVTDPQTGEEYIQVRMSEKMADKLGVTGWQRYLATGGIQFGKSSFNLALSNPLPGVGPLLQVPVNEVLKKKPELEAQLQFLLPYGVRANSREFLMSPLIRSFAAEVTGVEADRAYLRDYANVLTWMDVRYRTGESSVPPSEEVAHDAASKINTIRFVARLQFPSQPIFNSPMEPYIDIYRDLIETFGPTEADEIFLNEYGAEFLAVTLSKTVSKTGIPPTVEAETARRQFDDLITKYPEFGSLIIGDAAVGEFSAAAFASQLQNPMDPNNPLSEMERDYRFLDIDPRTGRIEEVDRRLGWQEYIKILDALDLERRTRGLPNLRVKEAGDLAILKASFTQKLAAQYPAWWEDFNMRDELKWDKRMDAFREIANNPLMDDRPDMEGIQDYLTTRAAILDELNRRKMLGGSSTLEATSNQDLAMLWENLKVKIVEENIAFAPVYYRYLEGDPVAARVGPLPEQPTGQTVPGQQVNLPQVQAGGVTSG